MDSEKGVTESKDFHTDPTKDGNGDSTLLQEQTNTSLPDEELHHKATYIPTGTAADLPQEHRDYLIKRHGTIELDPIPSDDPADPYNWPSWKKLANLVLVAFHAMMTTFIAAGIIPAFGPISEALGCSVTRASYLTSLQIAVLGWAPLFWRPIANRYGRRPVWLISTLGSMLFNIGCAKSTTYSSLAVCRAFTSFFISPAIAIGSGVVTETFFKKERGRYMGIWTLLVTLGPPSGPFFMGFVAYHVGFVWIFWINAIINGVQFILYLFLGPETRYIRRGISNRGSAFKQEYLSFRRIDPSPLHPREFIEPLFLARHMAILIPSISYSIVFGFASVLVTVEIPQLFLPKFGFNPQEIGLQFLGIIIGSIIGEQLSGPLSDWFMGARAKKLGPGRKPQPEYRLWLSYAGFLLAMVGLIVFGVRTAQAPMMHWNVTPIVGIAIAGAGNQIVTTVLVTYAVDCHLEHAASIGVFVNVIRSTWGFIGPFWFPNMFDSIGVAGSGGLMAGLIFIAGWVPIMFQQWMGQRWREGGKNGQVAT